MYPSDIIGTTASSGETPAMAVATGRAIARPPTPAIAVATGLLAATPPGPVHTYVYINNYNRINLLKVEALVNGSLNFKIM